MPLTVKLFASLRSRFGGEVILPIEPPVSVAEIACELQEKTAWTHGARIAVNHAFAHSTCTVEPGDEVAVIPPVSGG